MLPAPILNDSFQIEHVHDSTVNTHSSRDYTMKRLVFLLSFSIYILPLPNNSPVYAGSSVINQIRSPKKASPQMNFEPLALTEETEVIDGRKDHWIKIRFNSEIDGWIFGGYASVERGGPKYMTPENQIAFYLGWY